MVRRRLSMVYRFLAAPRVACGVLVITSLARAASAQTWNDPRSRALVSLATTRRAQQLADTGLTDYHANAHGYVTFLAQLGEGFLTPPKILKADELALEVYWRSPNLSKQRIIGRRDTLLLPTDIQYHRDHLGIVQNNFPNIIRLGDGDEVADVPHPLSPAGLNEYDFAVADSLDIQYPGGRIKVYEVKVRPKDDRKARVIGAVYVDPSGGQVVRMAFNFTRAAFLDKQLEGLEIVLENGLVGTRFWLPRRQEIEIRRSGTWLDYPVRGIIRGRWEISNYEFNINVPVQTFAGPEIVSAPPQQLAQHKWEGRILDALPPDIRAVTDANIAAVQAEARKLVRAQALSRVRSTSISARGISDFARFDRVEGLAVGQGVKRQFGSGFSATLRGRYGIDDNDGKGTATLAWQAPSGFGVRLFGLRDFRQAGDEPERSTVMNSLAAQEFGSDYTDPYFVRGGGIGFDFPQWASIHWSLNASLERHDSLTINARPVTGTFFPTLAVEGQGYYRLTLEGERAPALWFFGTELDADIEVRALLADTAGGRQNIRASIRANLERPFGDQRLVLRTLAAATSHGRGTTSELAFFGGPMTAPGYDYHALWSTAGVSQRVEWHFPIPFVPFSLGRFGRVPSRATLAPFVNAVALEGIPPCGLLDTSDPADRQPNLGCNNRPRAIYPSFGIGFLTPFDLIRLDVARGVNNGRWAFYIDISREFWSIL